MSYEATPLLSTVKLSSLIDAIKCKTNTQKDRHKDKHREEQTYRRTHRKTDIKTSTQKDRHQDKHTETQTYRQTHGKTDIKTKTQKDRNTDKHTEGRRYRQTHRRTETQTSTQKDRRIEKDPEGQTVWTNTQKNKHAKHNSTHGNDRVRLLDFSSPGDYKTHEDHNSIYYTCAIPYPILIYPILNTKLRNSCLLYNFKIQFSPAAHIPQYTCLCWCKCDFSSKMYT